ncbi:MAG: hypothetical protein ABIP55_10090 [Tepidisphaeraceae bacterium]
MVLSLLAVVVLGHLVCIFTFRDVWPFSRYAMYAGSMPVSRPLVIYRAYGVTDDATAAEFELGNGPLPLSDTVLRARWEREWADPKRTQASLLAAGQWYERLRARDEHSSAGGARPRFSAVRLYRLEWDVLPDASNRALPTRRVLLSETPMSERA